jgi:hypothetical protein
MRIWPILAVLIAMVSTTAAAQDVPAARVEAQAVIHSGAALTVRVPAGATYIGGERFTLYGAADAEIHAFVEADAARRIQRFYWIQFESYLPNQPDARYDYRGNKKVTVWGATAWVGAGVMDTARTPRAGSDTERVRAMIERAGYVAPPFAMSTRLIRLLDDPQGTGQGRKELMLIYAEDVPAFGLGPGDVTSNGALNPRLAPLAEATINRATTAFKVE